MLIFLNDISIHQTHNKHFCTKVLSKSYIQQQSKNTTVEIVFKQAPWRRRYACTGSRRLKTNLHIIYVNTIHDVIYRGVEKAQDLTKACRSNNNKTNSVNMYNKSYTAFFAYSWHRYHRYYTRGASNDLNDIHYCWQILNTSYHLVELL